MQNACITSNLRRCALGALVIVASACTSVTPIQGLASTIPLDTTNKRLAYIGNARGEACREDLLYFIPLASDASLFTAKNRALESVASARRAVALIDVAVDEQSTSYLLYRKTCTIVRGKAVGYETQAQPAPPVPTSRVETNAGLQELQKRTLAIRQCLAQSDSDTDVTVMLQIGKTGVPTSLRIAEVLPESDRRCIFEAFRGSRFPSASADYTLEYKYKREMLTHAE